MLKRLKQYCNCIAPSGCENKIRELIINDIKDTATSWEVDRMGNLTAFKKGKKTPQKKVLLSAHMDEIGFMMKYISEDGYIYFDNIGGIDPRVVMGRRIVIGEKQIPGVIASKAIHLQKASERGICVPISEMYIDIGCDDKDSCEQLVQVGDVGTFTPNFEIIGDSVIKSKAIDDRFGCALLVEMLHSELEFDTYFAFPVCEEVGTDGAKEIGFRFRPDIAIVIEATTAGDIYNAPKSRHACEQNGGAVLSHMDGGTIYDKHLVDFAKQTADKYGIEYQMKNIVAGGNEASAYQKSGCGTRVLAISTPTRYIHSACNMAVIHDLCEIKEFVSALLERGFDHV